MFSLKNIHLPWIQQLKNCQCWYQDHIFESSICWSQSRRCRDRQRCSCDRIGRCPANGIERAKTICSQLRLFWNSYRKIGQVKREIDWQLLIALQWELWKSLNCIRGPKRSSIAIYIEVFHQIVLFKMLKKNWECSKNIIPPQ